ncbi:MAG: LysM peptidoglycan-binding domain-containing protein [Acidobacteriota bacterium]|nr:LysM peptidoglycan-binding domain-containing protein [Acidobacteriota bacterium]
MALKEKYQGLVDLAAKLPVKNAEFAEEGGKLRIKGTTVHQYEKNLFWDKIKTYANWEGEVGADIKVEQTDIFGVYTVAPGDTLSKIAKEFLDDAKRYPEIFNINKDVLSNPDVIKVGQKLKIPNK